MADVRSVPEITTGRRISTMVMLTEREKALKAMIEGHASRDPSTPLPTVDEMRVLERKARDISDRFHFGCGTVLDSLKRGRTPFRWIADQDLPLKLEEIPPREEANNARDS